jgi:hypothetical protein
MYYADVTAWSLFPMYRNRLSAGFVLRRTRRFAEDRPSPTAVGDEDASERPYEKKYLLSHFQPDDYPELIVCAAANVSDYGATPSGSHVSSFTFSATCIGGPLVGARPTTDYEKGLGPGLSQARFATLPTAMAISGAAISPSMGRMTRAPYRFFMALANLRLGVWVPNPRRLERFKKHRATGFSVIPRFRLLPRPIYLLREMLGRNGLNGNFLYVTDGGHYENLGLVELLRRKCKTIWCIDASGDKVDTFSTLGGALETAQSELQIGVWIRPKEDMVPRPAQGRPAQYVKQPFCVGKISYPDGTTGDLIVVKAGIPDTAPLSVRSFALQHVNFPCDTTLDQLYDADRFDAYRDLGSYCVGLARQSRKAAITKRDADIAAGK